ncbi:MAG: hypothetical protein Q7J34_13610 [Bacteroidales bacterium]|jgi:hypothetical protein|nr:hypothetical protein [Bacteroidales bacterium]
MQCGSSSNLVNARQFDNSTTSISATIDGTTEAIGGKFMNGAVTGAYVFLLNHVLHGDLLGKRFKKGKDVFAMAKSRTKCQPCGLKEIPFFVAKDVNNSEYYYYMMDESEYIATSTRAIFNLYTGNGKTFYLDKELTQLVITHFHTSYTNEGLFPTGSADDFRTSEKFNGLPVFYMNTDNFKCFLYQFPISYGIDYHRLRIMHDIK